MPPERHAPLHLPVRADLYVIFVAVFVIVGCFRDGGGRWECGGGHIDNLLLLCMATLSGPVVQLAIASITNFYCVTFSFLPGTLQTDRHDRMEGSRFWMVLIQQPFPGKQQYLSHFQESHVSRHLWKDRFRTHEPHEKYPKERHGAYMGMTQLEDFATGFGLFLRGITPYCSKMCSWNR